MTSNYDDCYLVGFVSLVGVVYFKKTQQVMTLQNPVS